MELAKQDRSSEALTGSTLSVFFLPFSDQNSMKIKILSINEGL